MASERILIFIVAYNAGNHIRSVLDRLPREVFNSPRFHVLIIDDCSKDETAKVASAHVSHCKFENVTVMRNPINQGYGGNQKLGYRFAVQNGYDLVILLHGDGQYAPELVLEFVNKWKPQGSSARADVVLGSRMINKAKAREGGMPLYKWVGNQVLTTFQNWVIGSRLSEFHTGYRAYDTRFLAKVPFELNTNDFHFDTEILLQAFATEAKVVEFPIPTHYGDEICHVDGMKYAKDVVRACLSYRFQKVGFFVSMQYRGLLKHDEGRRGSTHFHLFERLKQPGRVLNLGDDSKYLETKFRELGSTFVTGSRQADATGKLSEDISAYDYVVALDVLEKLGDAEKFLIDCRYSMGDIAKRPTFVFSTGNVAFFALRIMLGLGLFNYGERGILKNGHKRLFTLFSLRNMLDGSGYESGQVRGIGVPFQLVFKGGLGRALAAASDFAARVWPSLFAYQFLIEARPRPHTFMLLTQAERFYEAPSGEAGLSR